jgi:hypothetical protein
MTESEVSLFESLVRPTTQPFGSTEPCVVGGGITTSCGTGAGRL